MTRLRSTAARIAAAFVAAMLPAAAHAHAGHAKPEAAQAGARAPSPARVALSDATLVDQDGVARKLRSDVVREQIVLVDFIYTTCTTVCPVISQTFADVRRRLGPAQDVTLVSITVDPARDTPAALKAFGAKHGAGEGWVWLTGAPPVVNGVLKEMGAYVADASRHAPMVLVGDARSGQWQRFYGFPNAKELVAKVDALRAARGGPAAAATGPRGRDYFGDNVFVAQDGRRLRFYSDVLQDRVVLVNFMYADCGDACPMITHALMRAKQELGERFGRDVRFVSLSVDPARDTPADLLRYARKFGAEHREWLFLTGEPAQVEPVLRKLGGYTPEPGDHNTAILIGNLRTERWRKLRPDTPPAIIAAELRALLESPAAAAR